MHDPAQTELYKDQDLMEIVDQKAFDVSDCSSSLDESKSNPLYVEEGMQFGLKKKESSEECKSSESEGNLTGEADIFSRIRDFQDESKNEANFSAKEKEDYHKSGTPSFSIVQSPKKINKVYKGDSFGVKQDILLGSVKIQHEESKFGNKKEEEFDGEDLLQIHDIEDKNLEGDDAEVSDDDIKVVKQPEGLKNTKKSLRNLGTSFVTQDEAKAMISRSATQSLSGPLTVRQTMDFSKLKLTPDNREDKIYNAVDGRMSFGKSRTKDL